jgi:hypothetical protein
MRTRMAAILLAGVAILAFGVRVTPSSATTATTIYWTVTPAGTTVGIPASMFTLTDTLTGGTVDCPSGEPVVYWPHHGPWPGPLLGNVTQYSFGTCTDQLGQSLNLTEGGPSWDVNLNSYDAATGVTTGTVTGINISVAGSGCSATIDGTSPGADNGQVTDTFTNSTNTLNVLTSGASLRAFNVSGCSGVFHNGDPLTISASYHQSPSLNLVSP